MAQDQLAAFYRDASVGLITPLRDGMNLVAKVIRSKVTHRRTVVSRSLLPASQMATLACSSSPPSLGQEASCRKLSRCHCLPLKVYQPPAGEPLRGGERGGHPGPGPGDAPGPAPDEDVPVKEEREEDGRVSLGQGLPGDHGGHL